MAKDEQVVAEALGWWFAAVPRLLLRREARASGLDVLELWPAPPRPPVVR